MTVRPRGEKPLELTAKQTAVLALLRAAGKPVESKQLTQQARCGQGPLEALVIFTGPDAYITPEWYRTKVETGRVVPTWNYVAVHAAGVARSFEDAPSLLRHLNELTDFQETPLPDPWSVADAPPEYIEGMTKAIVGIEISVDRLEGKWKVNQNRSTADQEGVMIGLEALDSHASHEMANLIRDRRSLTR